MKVGKSKVVAITGLAALGGVAAVALAGQPGAGTDASAEPVAALDDRTKLKPKVKREVVHRTRHVQAKRQASSGSGPAAVAASGGSAPVASAATPVSAVPATPAGSAGGSGDDSGSHGQGGSPAAGNQGGGEIEDHEYEDEHEYENEDEDEDEFEPEDEHDD